MEEKIRNYLQSLESGDYQQVMRLFAPGAVVHSPLYGFRPAREFYRELLADSAASRIHLLHIYHQPGSLRSAVHFTYEWTLADGGQAVFDCVDLFEWDEEQKITQLKIIYDTSQTRPAFERQRNQRP